VKLSTEIAGLTRRANVESVTKHIQTWGDNELRHPTRWQNVIYLCYELAKSTQTIAVGGPTWDGPMREWVYVMPDGIGVEMKGLVFNLEPEAWYYEVGMAPWPDARSLEFIGHRDHWTRVWYWVLATLAVHAANGKPYAGVERVVKGRLAGVTYLQGMVDRILPKAIEAYRKVRGFDPSLGELSVSFSEIVPPDGKIAVYQRFDCKAKQCEGAISIHPKALRDEGGEQYLETVLTHELVHYLLNSTNAADAHGGEFQAVSTLLGIPREFQD